MIKILRPDKIHAKFFSETLMDILEILGFSYFGFKYFILILFICLTVFSTRRGVKISQ